MTLWGCFRPLYRGLFSIKSCARSTPFSQDSFRPLYRGLFSISPDRGTHPIRAAGVFSSPLSGTFFNLDGAKQFPTASGSFRPLYRGLFSICTRPAQGLHCCEFSSPLSGTFFNQRACEAPARLLSQAHSRRGWGNRFIRHSPSEMKCRFSQAGRASAGICNEKIEMRNGGAAHKNMEPSRRFETSGFLVSQT